MQYKSLTTAALLISLLSSPLAWGGWYIGAGVGLSDSNIDTAVNEGADELVNSINIDDNDTGWKLFGGYQLTGLLAAELAYVDLGRQSAGIGTGGAVRDNLSVEAKADTDGFSLTGLASFNLIPVFSVYGRLGVYRWDTDITALVSALGALREVSTSDDGTDLTYGFGAKAQLGPVAGRLEWERFQNLGGSDFDLYTLNILYEF